MLLTNPMYLALNLGDSSAFSNIPISRGDVTVLLIIAVVDCTVRGLGVAAHSLGPEVLVL